MESGCLRSRFSHSTFGDKLVGAGDSLDTATILKLLVLENT